MIITHKITMDLVRKDRTPCVHVMQNDKYSRDLELKLRVNGVDYLPDPSTTAVIRYKKPDGTCGMYDTMPDGTRAWSLGKDRVTVRLAPQVCTVAGEVQLSVVFYRGQEELSSFAVCLEVQEQIGKHFISETYLNVAGFMPLPASGKPGEFIQVKETDEYGNVTAVQSVPVEAPGTLYVTVTQEDGALKADKTLEEMENAYQKGRTILCEYEMAVHQILFRIDEATWVFGGMVDIGIQSVVIFAEGDIMQQTTVLLTAEQLPQSLPNPENLIFTGAVNATYNGSSRVTVNIPRTGGTGVPAYVSDEAERLAKVVQSRQNGNTITFLACSDLHYSSTVSTAVQQEESLTHCGQAMELIRKTVHVDFAAMLGDLVWDGAETVDRALGAMRFVNRCVYPGFLGIPGFRARGNHDCLYSDATGLTDSQIFANVGAFNAGAVFDENNRQGGYCYRDFEDRKLRVICLNTSENDRGNFAVSEAQNAWLQGALNVGEGWKIILLSHHPLDWAGSNTNVMQTVKAASNILCAFHGHLHNFKVDGLTGTAWNRIAIPNACFGRENEYGQNGRTENDEGIEFGETTTYAKTAASGQDTSFCVVTLDLGAKLAYVDHYGAGYDRVVPLDRVVDAPFTVTNNLTNVTTSNVAASVSNGGAYTASLYVPGGYALNSVSVTMGGEDVTGSVFYGGRINIPTVTGNVVITAASVALSGNFTNLVPTSLDFDGSGVFNSVGYYDGCYVSTTAPYRTNTTDGSVTTGLIPYRVYGEGNTTHYQPPTIYIRGVAFDVTKVRNRVGMFDGALECKTTPFADTLEQYYDVEQLGLLYCRLTPKMNANGQNMMAASGFYVITHIALTGNGMGANMIVTLDQPIV